MKTYFKGIIHKSVLENGTAKAFFVDYDDGRYSAARNGHIWIPRSLCITETPNELGYLKILIPQWFFKQNRIEYSRITNIVFGISGEGLVETR